MLNLYEQQSSYNPNMPLRGLFYITRIYQNYIQSVRANIYGKKRISLPIPKYVVFYNRKEERDCQELKLSDAFECTGEPAVECRAGYAEGVKKITGECIAKNILRKFQEKNQAEVFGVILE